MVTIIFLSPQGLEIPMQRYLPLVLALQPEGVPQPRLIRSVRVPAVDPTITLGPRPKPRSRAY